MEQMAIAEAPRLILPREDASLFKRDDVNGHVRKVARTFPMEAPTGEGWRQRSLAWLRDNVNVQIPRWYYQMVLGHPLHISSWGALQARIFRADERDPFRPSRLGFWENLGVVSLGKITVAFRDFECDQLVAESSIYGDFKYHEVGTDGTAESNTQTALIVSSGIARVTGSQTNPTDPTYVSVATITADATESWQEHGLFNALTGVTMVDRSKFTAIAVNASDQVEFTHTFTKAAEA